jgi:hypothetical protein
MKPIQKDELFEHVAQFLKTKGIELKDGSYPKAVQKGCSILADAINLSQRGIGEARARIEKNLDRMRQVIHQKTAPKTGAKGGSAPKAKTRTRKPKNARRKPAAPKA